MVENLHHKGVRRFFETGSTAGIPSQFARRLGVILGVLNRAVEIRDMDLPGFRLHRLKGRRRETWSVWVSGNWRVTFRFEVGKAFAVNLEDYH